MNDRDGNQIDSEWNRGECKPDWMPGVHAYWEGQIEFMGWASRYGVYVAAGAKVSTMIRVLGGSFGVRYSDS